jgi:hypothetical protein
VAAGPIASSSTWVDLVISAGDEADGAWFEWPQDNQTLKFHQLAIAASLSLPTFP